MNSDLIVNGAVLVISLSAVVGLTIAGTLHKLGREISELLEADAWSSPHLEPARSSSYDRARVGRTNFALLKPFRE